MTVRFKARELRDIETIHRHIAQADPGSCRAGRAANRACDWTAGSLSAVPPGRELDYWRYLGFPLSWFTVQGDSVDIVGVLHTARRRRR
jgi:plasmid stabilization system protein ParE